MEALDQLGKRIESTFEESKVRFSEERKRTYAYAFDASASLERLKELTASFSVPREKLPSLPRLDLDR